MFVQFSWYILNFMNLKKLTLGYDWLRKNKQSPVPLVPRAAYFVFWVGSTWHLMPGWTRQQGNIQVGYLWAASTLWRKTRETLARLAPYHTYQHRICGQNSMELTNNENHNKSRNRNKIRTAGFVRKCISKRIHSNDQVGVKVYRAGRVWEQCPNYRHKYG